MRRKILVAGATGNVGSALMHALRQRNIDFIAGVRSRRKACALEAQGIAATEFNYEDSVCMVKAFGSAERAFILLPLTPAMLEYGEAAVKAAHEAGVSYVVKSSEFGADAGSPKLALRTQGRVDLALRQTGIPCTILRPNFFMQNYAAYYGESIRTRHAFRLPQGGGAVSFIDVRDIADAAAELLAVPDRHVGKEYDLTGPQALSNFDVAAILAGFLGRRVEYQPLSDEEAVKDMQGRGQPQWIIDFVMSLHGLVREGRMAGMTDSVESITGQPARSFAAFVKEHVGAWSAAGKIKTA